MVMGAPDRDSTRAVKECPGLVCQVLSEPTRSLGLALRGQSRKPLPNSEMEEETSDSEGRVSIWMTFSSSYPNCIETYGRNAPCISEYVHIASNTASTERFSSKRSGLEMHASPIRGLFF